MRASAAVKDTNEQESAGLSRNQERAIVALLSHSTIAEAAKSIDVSEASIWRWMQDENFKAKLDDARARVFNDALSSLQSASATAVKTLTEVMNGTNEPSRVQAAKIVIEYTLKGKLIQEYEARIKSLEAALKARIEAEDDDDS